MWASTVRGLSLAAQGTSSTRCHHGICKWSDFAHLLGFFSLLVSGLLSAVQDSFLCKALGFPVALACLSTLLEAMTLLLSCVLSSSLFSPCLSSSEMELDLFN